VWLSKREKDALFGSLNTIEARLLNIERKLNAMPTVDEILTKCDATLQKATDAKTRADAKAPVDLQPVSDKLDQIGGVIDSIDPAPPPAQMPPDETPPAS